MLSVALTGNVGCGKSTVAAAFRDLGAAVLDADAIVHALMDVGGAAVEDLLAAFPEAEDPDSRRVDRRALGALVFSDESRRRELESIVHPFVTAESQRRLAELAAAGTELAITEVALLYEAAERGTTGSRSLQRFDQVVVVTCDEAKQLERIIARSSDEPDRAEADARRRMAAQMPQEEKASRADHVIDNSGDLDGTLDRVRVVHSALVSSLPC